MDTDRRNELIQIYKNCGDDELILMIDEGEDCYEDGAYDLIMGEARRRGISNDSDEFSGEIDFSRMSDQDLMGVLVNIHSLDELNFHLASAEAVRRNIDSSDIRAFKKIVNCEQCAEPVQIEVIENPRPLIIVNSISEADLYADALDEENIPYEIQIIVDDSDYKRAELATADIILSAADE